MALVFISFLSLSLACSKNPEDGLKGREHWVTTRTDRGTIYYMYDLGSVRRADNMVIVKIRKVDDINFELSENNMKRQSAGHPLYLGASGTLILECRKRTSRGISVVADYADGSTQRIEDSKEQIVLPNSGIEEIYDFLCAKSSGLLG